MDLDSKKICYAWLLERSEPMRLLWSQQLCDASCKAASEGQVEVLRYLLEVVVMADGDCWAPDMRHCVAAAKAGQIQVLDWLNDHVDHAWSSRVCTAAVRGHQMEALHWLQTVCEPPCPCDIQTMRSAAEQGRRDMLQYMRSLEPPAPWDSKCMTVAVQNGDWRLMEWLRAQDPPCEMGTDTLSAAVARCNLPMVQWLCQQSPPCPCSASCFMGALETGSFELVEWLLLNIKPSPWRSIWALSIA